MMHVTIPTSPTNVKSNVKRSRLQESGAAGVFLCGSGEGLPCEKMAITKQTRQTNESRFCSFVRRTSTYHRMTHTGMSKCVEFSRMARVLSTVLVRPAARSSRSESGYWDVRIPLLLLIILDSFWRRSRGHGHVLWRLLPSPPRGHGAEGSPAALPVSTWAEPDASDCGPNLTSLLRAKEIFSFQRTHARVSRIAQFWQFRRRGRGWEESEREGAATFHVTVPTSRKLEARCWWETVSRDQLTGRSVVTESLPFRDGRVNTWATD